MGHQLPPLRAVLPKTRPRPRFTVVRHPGLDDRPPCGVMAGTILFLPSALFTPLLGLSPALIRRRLHEYPVLTGYPELTPAGLEGLKELHALFPSGPNVLELS